MKKLIFIICIVSFFVGTAHVVHAGSFKVIVNNSNSVSSMTRDQITAIFLKKNTSWKSGIKIVPVDLPKSSATRESFSKEVLGKNISSVNSYWQQRIFSGRGVPPLKKGSDGEVVAYVKSNSGAIGYVSSSASTEGVKVIKVTN